MVTSLIMFYIILDCSFQQYIDIYYHGNPRKIPPAHAVQKSIIGKVGKSIIKDHDLNTFSDSDDIDESMLPSNAWMRD